MNEDKIKEKYLELQLAGSHIKELQDHIETLATKQQNVQGVRDSLDQLRKTKKGDESLVPVADGIFVRMSVKDINSLLVNVGSDVCVEKTIPDTQKLLDTRLTEIDMQRTQMLRDMQEIAAAANQIEADIAKLISK